MSLVTDRFKPYHLAAEEDRCAPRTPISIQAILRPSCDPGFGVAVTDVSIAGFACEAVSSMRPGARCWLTLPGLAGLQAEVIWNTGAMIGCAFTNLMNQAVLDNVLQKARG